VIELLFNDIYVADTESNLAKKERFHFVAYFKGLVRVRQSCCSKAGVIEVRFCDASLATREINARTLK